MSETSPDLHSGIAAARAGQQAEARSALMRVLKLEPRNESAWFWMSRAMPTIEQSLRCIEHLLTINPTHRQALEARDVLNVRLLLEEAAVTRTSTKPPTSTPQRRYLLGEALVEARVITPQQLASALTVQQQYAHKNISLRLGEVLLHMKLVRPEQIEGAIAAQIENQPTVASGATGHIGEYLMRCGLITRAQLHQGLVQQAQLKRQGRSVLLGDQLVECGYIKREQLNRALLDWQQQYELAFR
jgi:hypothetical protein